MIVGRTCNRRIQEQQHLVGDRSRVKHAGTSKAEVLKGLRMNVSCEFIHGVGGGVEAWGMVAGEVREGKVFYREWSKLGVEGRFWSVEMRYAKYETRNSNAQSKAECGEWLHNGRGYS